MPQFDRTPPVTPYMSSKMPIESEKPADPATPPSSAAAGGGGDPQAPMQVFPAPGQSDPSMTATNVREFREEVLRELETDLAESAQPASPGALNLVARLALACLLLVSLLVIVSTLWQNSTPLKQEAPGAVASVDAVLPVEAIAPVPPPPPVPAETQPSAAPKASPATPGSVPGDARLAEIEVISTLIRNDPSFNDESALARLRPYMQSSDAVVKAAANKALAPVLKRAMDTIQARLDAAIAAARGQLESEDYPAALKTCAAAREALKLEQLPNGEFAARLAALRQEIEAARAKKLATAFDQLESGLEAGDARARERLASLLAHKDEAISARAKEIQARVEARLAATRAARLKREAAGRAAWQGFFEKYHAAMAGAQFDAARQLVAQPSAALLGGGVAAPDAVLKSCRAEIEAIAGLQDEVLANIAAGKPRACNLPLKKGSLSGTLNGVHGRQISIAVEGGAVFMVKVETLTAAAIVNILGKELIERKKLAPALWAMGAYENPAQAEAFLKARYGLGADAKEGALRQPLPAQWQAFFALQAHRASAEKLEHSFAALKLAVEASNRDAIRAALEALRPVAAEFEKVEPLSAAQSLALSGAEKVAGHARRMKLVLQNGIKPGDGASAPYNGQASDQIGDYKESLNKTDVGVQWGLKLGASGGLQRVLLRFEGLENALGKARVIGARLELYQIDSPQYNGAVIGLFRLKRPWAPGSGSWLCYDTARKLKWSAPGAGGEADIVPREDARVAIDQNHGLWRSWDVTAYVQDVLAGKAQNNGFLMRVVNGEPDFHVRFYPETDIENAKDAMLRPRLVLDIEREVP